MTKTLCNACKQLVEPDAKTCPNCGEDYPTVDRARQLKLIAAVGLVLGLWIAVYSGWTTLTRNVQGAPESAQEQTGPRGPLQVLNGKIVYYQTLGQTPKQYADRVNAFLKAANLSYTIDTANIDVGEVYDFLNAELGPFVVLTASIQKDSGQLDSIAIFAGGDGNRSSGEEIVTVASAALAGASPGADPQEIKQRFEDMVRKDEPYRHGYVEFKAGVTQMMGSWFSADPIRPE
ncbi:zinc ribbon domain-containing protein [Pseudomonas sp. H9]|uniref:zinc ribbon domain-containing protein n=1 Tax=Pseudomonas sp. H9 TaxID=483968 RepID=UPI0010577C08|nr:zinc ribbon domain-containing protein [Pseudomonas sp. H9]TDF83899.1 zinc ribbon domain-containing protein [Pseudomonas sp. H9]